ncbi:MAG: hypothetical protein WBE18_04420 [Gammaproteobacteria bacterium]
MLQKNASQLRRAINRIANDANTLLGVADLDKMLKAFASTSLEGGNDVAPLKARIENYDPPLKDSLIKLCSRCNQEGDVITLHNEVLKSTLELLDALDALKNSSIPLKQKTLAVENYSKKMLPLQAVVHDLWEITVIITIAACAFILLATAAKILFMAFLPALPVLLVTSIVLVIGGVPLGTSISFTMSSAASSIYAFFKATPVDDAVEAVALDSRRFLAKQPTVLPKEQSTPDAPRDAPKDSTPDDPKASTP